MIAEQDRQANARAHADMEFLAREVASLRMAVGEVATRDFLRSELRYLLSELDELVRRGRGRGGHARSEDRQLRWSHYECPHHSTGSPRPSRTVNDPEIKRPITELGMVDHLEVDDAGLVDGHRAADGLRLPDEGHHRPRRDGGALRAVDGVTGVELTLGVMTRRAARPSCRSTLRGGQAQPRRSRSPSRAR